MAGEERRRRVTVRGRVQGVGYRAWVQETARGLGVRARAVNQPDGTVDVVVEGSPDSVDALVATLRSGSGPGRTEAVEPADR